MSQLSQLEVIKRPYFVFDTDKEKGMVIFKIMDAEKENVLLHMNFYPEDAVTVAQMLLSRADDLNEVNG